MQQDRAVVQLAKSLVQASPIDVSLLSERVYAALREEILCQSLPPGTRLDVRDLAAVYDTSVAPVRQALVRLREDGLVEISPRRGTFVSQFGPADIREIFQVRRMLETGAAEILDARLPEEIQARLDEVVEQIEALADGDDFRDYDSYIRLDAEFHQLPLTALANQRLVRVYQELRSHIHVARGLYPRANKRAPETLAEHRAIQDGFHAHDVLKTRHAILRHLANAEFDLLRQRPNEQDSTEEVRLAQRSRPTTVQNRGG